MKELHDMESIQKQMEEKGFQFFYFSRPACGVCGAIKEKALSMLTDYPGIKSWYVNLDLVPEAAGQLSLFTIPAILLYSDGHELVREARYISMDDLEAKIARPYALSAMGE
ncbi:MAG: thioredoxin family protein [Spirochaetales bacterium]|nr:thioredoxin family protein [Spirochaetales bacterium]